MSIWGIGLALALFWSMAGVGGYLTVASLSRLRHATLLSRVSLGSARAAGAGGSFTTLINFVLFLVGAALVFEGLWFTYVVIFR